MKNFYKHEIFLLILILFFASLLRIVYLDRIPTGIGQDEIDYQLTAKSMLLSGKDISGTVGLLDILTFHYPPTDSPKAELPYFLALLSAAQGGLSLFSARIVFALISVATVLLMYVIARYFFGKQVAIVSSILFAINPWEIFIGRTSFEVVPAVFFFLLLLYSFLLCNKWKVLWTIPLIVLAFCSYIATKVIIFPFIICIMLYLYFVEKRKENKIPYVIVCFFSLGLLLFFFVTVSSQSGSRISDILTPFSHSITDEVNSARKDTIASPLTVVFENKFSVYIRILLTKFIEAISLQYLFLYGDTFISLLKHGIYYLLDGVFFLYGIFKLLEKERKKIFIFLPLLLLSFIPQVLHKGTGNFTPHISLLFPFSFFIIAYGITSGFKKLQRKYQIPYMLFIIIGYGVSLLYFIHVYFFFYPIKSQSFDFPTRVLSRYVSLAAEKGKRVSILSSYNDDTYKKVLFYTSYENRKTLRELKIAFKTRTYTLGNVHIGSCNDTTPADITIYNTNCVESMRTEKTISVADLFDSGERYRIVNDMVCRNSSVPHYISHISLNSLSIENATTDMLCSTFLIAK
jgi:4-amino-4-deoxy-L-arabinose transferase-like glycosyltransferase